MSERLLPSSMPIQRKQLQLNAANKTAVRTTGEITSYRPISNLSVMSKLLERLVARQLIDYLTVFKLLPELQSTYRAHHSNRDGGPQGAW